MTTTGLLGNIEPPTIDVWARGATAIAAANLPIIGWSWERRLDDIGEASCTVLDPCSNLFTAVGDPIEDWSHELTFSHGTGYPDAWVGPMRRVAVQPGTGTATLRAKTLASWYGRRTIKQSINPTGVSLDGGDLLRLIHTEAITRQDISPRFTVADTTMGLSGVRTWVGSEQVYAAAAVKELADTILDWTDYGRTVLVRPTQTTPTAVLSRDDFLQLPEVVSDGEIRATEVVYKGASGTTPQAARASAAYIARYGLITRRFSDSKIGDNAGLLQAATARLALLQDAVYIDTSQSLSLTTTAPVTLDDLVPGAIFNVEAQAGWCNADVFTGSFRLTRVRAEGSNSDPTVRVSIDLSPLGDDLSSGDS